MDNPHTNQLHYREIINYFVNKFGYKSYLELGLRDPNNTFIHINCENKESVDVNPHCGPTYHMTTDQFFNTAGNNRTWDIIFIDADHEKEQVLKDFNNALKRLNPNGTIIMDDINPTAEWLLTPQFCHNAWEAFAELGRRSDIEIHAVVPSFSGFVRKGSQEPHTLEVVSTFEFLEKNREIITRPVTFEQLEKMF